MKMIVQLLGRLLYSVMMLPVQVLLILGSGVRLAAVMNLLGFSVGLFWGILGSYHFLYGGNSSAFEVCSLGFFKIDAILYISLP